MNNNSDSSVIDSLKQSLVAAPRAIFENAYNYFKQQQCKEERVLLLDAWRNCELTLISNQLPGNVAAVDAKLPKKVKMKRMAVNEEGVEVGWEEYFDYLFPDDEQKISKFRGIPEHVILPQFS